MSYSAEAAARTPVQRAVWIGQLQLLDATLAVPGVAMPLKRVEGKATFDEKTFDLPRVTGMIEQMPFTASYHYNATARHIERLQVEFQKADLEQIEAALQPSLSDDSLLSHLPFRGRPIPAWMANRSMEGEVSVSNLSIQENLVGAVTTHFLWQGPAIQLTNVQVGLPAGQMQGTGAVALSARLPRYHLVMKLKGYPWGGGVVAANGILDSSGMGVMALQHLEAAGQFTGEGLRSPAMICLARCREDFSSALRVIPLCLS